VPANRNVGPFARSYAVLVCRDRETQAGVGGRVQDRHPPMEVFVARCQMRIDDDERLRACMQCPA